MATATIITNLGNLAWQGVGDTNITESEDTLVTNSSGASVYWGVSSLTTELKNNKTHLFKPEESTIIYGFAQSSGSAAQITLTMTGTGGGGGLQGPLANQNASSNNGASVSAEAKANHGKPGDDD